MKINFSKLLCTVTTFLSIFLISRGLSANELGEPIDIYMIVIPLSISLTGITYSFYLNKAKTENLSKQRVRYLLIRLALEKYITKDQFEELCEEVEQIDSAIEEKLQEAFTTEVNKDIHREDI